MVGISSNALKGANYPENRKKYNGNELQSKEFSDGSGLELYDFNARAYDQQIGRFMQIDPWIEVATQEMLTPYQFSYNNPIRYNDPDGKCPFCPALPFLPAIGTAVGDGLVALGAAVGITAVAEKIYTNVIQPALESGAVSSMDHMPSFVIQRPSTVKSEEAQNLEKEVKSLEKGVKNHEKTIKEHEQKLEDYRNDPDKHDNKGELKDLTKEQRDRRVEGRIKALEKQIKNQNEALNRDQKKLETVKKELDKVNKVKEN